jgi:hypothetical protein
MWILKFSPGTELIIKHVTSGSELGLETKVLTSTAAEILAGQFVIWWHLVRFEGELLTSETV